MTLQVRVLLLRPFMKQLTIDIIESQLDKIDEEVDYIVIQRILNNQKEV